MPEPIWTKRSPNSILTLQLPLFLFFFCLPRPSSKLGPQLCLDLSTATVWRCCENRLQAEEWKAMKRGLQRIRGIRLLWLSHPCCSEAVLVWQCVSACTYICAEDTGFLFIQQSHQTLKNYNLQITVVLMCIYYILKFWNVENKIKLLGLLLHVCIFLNYLFILMHISIKYKWVHAW